MSRKPTKLQREREAELVEALLRELASGEPMSVHALELAIDAGHRRITSLLGKLFADGCVRKVRGYRGTPAWTIATEVGTEIGTELGSSARSCDAAANVASSTEMHEASPTTTMIQISAQELEEIGRRAFESAYENTARVVRLVIATTEALEYDQSTTGELLDSAQADFARKDPPDPDEWITKLWTIHVAAAAKHGDRRPRWPLRAADLPPEVDDGN